MPICDCGALTGRYVVHMETPDGKPLAKSFTSCPTCHPEEFPADQPHAQSLDRVVTGPEAMPHRYKLGGDGILRPTDELMQDTRDIICAEGPTARIERLKRERRRTLPMSEAEIRAAVRWGNECLKPLLKSAESTH